MLHQLGEFLEEVSRLARPYWSSKERWAARQLLAAIVAMNLGLVYVNVLFSSWNNRFYDALQARDFARFSHELAYFCGLAVVFIVIAVYQTYLNQMLQIRWRRWLTERYVDGWLKGGVPYRMQVGDQTADNPDQRIASDLQLFVDATLNLGLGLLNAVVTLVSFVAILWRLSGTLRLPANGFSLAIPGYMVWVAVLYAFAGSWLAHRIGQPLIALNFRQQQVEANFRYSLVRVRENAEGIALHQGEASEAMRLRDCFSDVVENWWAIMRRQKRLTWFSASYGQGAIVFPILAAAPRYFSGAIKLGGLMQTAQAFGQVQGALSWFVSAYASLAQWRATVQRLTQFQATIAAARSPGDLERIARTAGPGDEIALRDLSLSLPDGRPLSERIVITLRRGESVLISGPSGVGKSTLLRAIAGIWTHGNGRIVVPARSTLYSLPQRPYLPTGSLRTVLDYPDGRTSSREAELAEILDACGLSRLATRLEETGNWGAQLSPGEQQRLAFARVFLQRPAWLFLDEATSALDAAGEAKLYGELRRRLPLTTVVSIGHRSSLRAFHDRLIEWTFAPCAKDGSVSDKVAHLEDGFAQAGTETGAGSLAGGVLTVTARP